MRDLDQEKEENERKGRRKERENKDFMKNKCMNEFCINQEVGDTKLIPFFILLELWKCFTIVLKRLHWFLKEF